MSEETIGQRIAGEAKKALHLTLYFGFWFSALILLTNEILKQDGLPFGHWGLAWIKAAICAKFILIGQAVYPMRHSNGRDLWRIVLPRSLVYLAIVFALSVVEAIIEGRFHDEAVLFSIQHFANGNPLYAFALAWVYWLILVPYLLMGSLGRFIEENA
jgi:hypothetical protein